MEQVLDKQTVSERLAHLEGWELSHDTKAISKSLSFADFARALWFVNTVGLLANTENHHPDIEFGWGRVKISLSTHSAGGITAKDIDLATKIDALPRAEVI